MEDEDAKEGQDNSDDDGGGVYQDNIQQQAVNIAKLEASLASHRDGSVPPPWDWTCDPHGWVECTKMYAKFIRYASLHPEYVSGGQGARVHEIDNFLELINLALVQGLESMRTTGHMDARAMPESIIINIVFGPACFEAFTMHHRYMLLLQTM